MILHADLTSGASGDKLLAALLDIAEKTARFTLEQLEATIAALIPDTRLARSTVIREGIAASHIEVIEGALNVHSSEESHASSHHRHWSDIRALIEEAPLSLGARERTLVCFEKVARAEARVHGVAIDEVHFHEVGAADSIADIVGVCVLLDALEVTDFHATPLALGFGTLECAHGTLPVPAPATAEILAAGSEAGSIPVYAGSTRGELTTPTGAALIASSITSFEPLPFCTPLAIGYGAGSKEFAGLPNVVRIIAADAVNDSQATSSGSAAKHPRLTIEQVTLLETNIDHISGEAAAFAASELMNAGALDVWQAPITAKKGRLGFTLYVLCKPSQADTLATLTHELTGSLGVRRRTVERTVAPREIFSLETPYGEVRFKATPLEDPLTRATWIRPENDDVARIAHERGIEFASLARELTSWAQSQS